jgi:hypothetical protein
LEAIDGLESIFESASFATSPPEPKVEPAIRGSTSSLSDLATGNGDPDR